jgi:glucose/arabinose dehydrogenase
MSRIRFIKLCVITLFVAFGALTPFTDDFGGRRAHAKSTGPDPGHTGAPSEKTCDECHVPDAQSVPPGQLLIGAPQSYVPGQTYQITVNESNASPTRQRWGFQLTAIDDNGDGAGTLAAGVDGRTQVIGGFAPNPTRQYVEHTSAGTSVGQSNGTSWTFNWTAPASNVGPVTFYAAGNQANNDNNSSGDTISTIFVVVPPSASTGDFSVTVVPSTQVIIPGASGTFTVTVTPTGGFTGAVSLGVTGLPAGAGGVFNPTSINITDASAKTSTLTVTNNSATPLGRFNLTFNAAAGATTHTATATLVTGPTMTDANLTVRQLASGFDQPTSLAFLHPSLPNNCEYFVLEKATGKVIYQPCGAAGGVVLDLAVNSFSERGLLGIALHPNFPTNPRVYLYWTESSTGADSANAADVATLANRVDSFLWNGSTLALERNLIKLRAFQQDGAQALRGNHNGGVIRFGPDGKLYVVIGDNGRRGNLQNLRFGPSVSPDGPTTTDDQFGGPEPDNNHLTGVVLRLNDDGTTPTDNPFFNATTSLSPEAAANVKKIFAYGIRNTFGLAFDPVSGYLWEEENGDDSFDEMNRITPGFDGGWIQLMGPSSRVAQFKQIEQSFAGGLQQDRWTPAQIADTPADALARLFVLPGSHYTEPQFSWKYALAPSPVGFVRGRGLGPAFENDLLVGASRTTLAGGYLFRFHLTRDRRDLDLSADARLSDRVADNTAKFDLTESETLLVGRDFGITTDIETAPNGNVLIVSNTNGAIYELSARANTIQFASATFNTSEDDTENTPRATITVTRTGDTSGAASIAYRTVDDPSPVRCDVVNGTAYARCDYTTSVGTITFNAGESSKTFTVPIIDDAFVEGSESFNVQLSNPSGATLGAQAIATVRISDNDSFSTANPILSTDFFVRQQYLDFLSREPEAGQPWSAVLNNCRSGDTTCDRISVSANFFRSQEFQLKGLFVYRFYKLALNRQPLYAEIVVDMASVTGTTTAEVQAKKGAFTTAFAQRQEFKNAYDSLTNQQFVDTLMNRYSIQSVTTPDPATPDGTTKVTLTRADLVNRLNQQSLTRAQVLRAIADSDQVGAAEFNPAFVAMQYFGYLRRDPDAQGYANWLQTINANPADFRAMVNGFMNSQEYRLRFGAP